MSSFSYGLQSLENAIVTEENSSYPNNPGAIMNATTGLPNNYGSNEAGLSALQNQLTSIFNGGSQYYNPDESLQDFATTYTGGNTQTGSTIAQLMGNGVTPETTLSEIAGMQGPAGSSSTPTDWGSSDSIWNTLTDPSSLWTKTKAFFDGPGSDSWNQQFGSTFGSSTSGLLSYVFSSRVAFFILGFICIGGGILMLKSTSAIVIQGAKAGAKVAELTA